jgi:hypothetical protein
MKQLSVETEKLDLTATTNDQRIISTETVVLSPQIFISGERHQGIGEYLRKAKETMDKTLCANISS